MQICRFKHPDSHFFPICHDSSDPVWSCLGTSYHLRSFRVKHWRWFSHPDCIPKMSPYCTWGFLLPLSLLLLCYFALCLLKLGKWWCFCGSFPGFPRMLICHYPSGPLRCSMSFFTQGLVLQNALGPDALEDAIAAAGTDGMLVICHLSWMSWTPFNWWCA